MPDLQQARRAANFTRYQPGQAQGHYESFFLRANHPTRPLAFWIRYTIFNPAQNSAGALGELWAIYFDGETHNHVAVKKEVALASCRFERDRFAVDLDAARLESGKLEGGASNGGCSITWDLSFTGTAEPLFLLPLKLYETALPSAKAIVGLPLAAFDGRLTVNGGDIDVRGWIGSQNHNWGRKHTDHYAWGQVAGFDTHTDSFLEIATARIKIGPLWTPFMTLLVLRHRGSEYAFNGMWQALKARGSFKDFTWRFQSEDSAVHIEGTICAPREAFVGLRYFNPPGGIKHCLNSKIAACRLTITDKRTGVPEILSTVHRAAFEILTDDATHGVEIRT